MECDVEDPGTTATLTYTQTVLGCTTAASDSDVAIQTECPPNSVREVQLLDEALLPYGSALKLQADVLDQFRTSRSTPAGCVITENAAAFELVKRRQTIYIVCRL